MINQIATFINNCGPLLAKGLATTIFLWLSSAALAFVVGVPVGIFNSEKLKIPTISFLIDSYVFLVRAIPVYVQVLITYFVIPDLLHTNLSPSVAAILALGICSSGYMAEIIRCGINAIPLGQWNACFILGYSRWQTVWYVIVPQTMNIIVPALFNELESLIKSTAILSAIGVVELTKVGNNIVARTMNPIPVYLAIAFLYLLISAVLRSICYYMERGVSYAKN